MHGPPIHPHAVERMQERKLILYKHLKLRTDNFVAAVIVEALPGGVTDVATVLVNFCKPNGKDYRFKRKDILKRA